jgi:hypothetical protein
LKEDEVGRACSTKGEEENVYRILVGGQNERSNRKLKMNFGGRY